MKIEGPASPEPRSRSFIDAVVAASLDQWPIVAFLALLVVGVGTWSFLRLPVDAYPDLSPPMVEIVTQWPGHAAEEVEQLITAPMELGMNGLPGLKVMRSISLYGLSDVRLTFNDGTDDYFARQRVFERLPDIALPPGLTPSVSRLFSPSGLVYRYVIDSPDRSPMELKVIQDWILERQYRSVPGVADMSSLGGETMQYQVVIDPVRLASRGLTVPMISTALSDQQRECRRRFLFRGRPVLLRARPGSHGDDRGRGADGAGGEERDTGAGEGCRRGRGGRGTAPRAVRVQRPE